MDTRYTTRLAAPLDQNDIPEYAERLASIIDSDPKKLETLLARGTKGLIRATSKDEAEKVASVFRRAGLEVEVVPRDPLATEPDSPSPQPEPVAETDTPSEPDATAEPSTPSEPEPAAETEAPATDVAMAKPQESAPDRPAEPAEPVEESEPEPESADGEPEHRSAAPEVAAETDFELTFDAEPEAQPPEASDPEPALETAPEVAAETASDDAAGPEPEAAADAETEITAPETDDAAATDEAADTAPEAPEAVAMEEDIASGEAESEAASTRVEEPLPTAKPPGVPTPSTSARTAGAGARLLGLVGAALLIARPFVPNVAATFGVDLADFGGSQVSGMIMLILGVLSLIPIIAGRLRWLWLTGLAALAALVFAFVTSDASANIAATLQNEWGWLVMLVGAVVLLLAGSLPSRRSS